MEGDRNDGPLKLHWSETKVTAELADLYEGTKTFGLKQFDYLRAEAMATEMKVPVGAVVGYAGLRLIAECRRTDPSKPLPIEDQLFDIQKDLLETEGIHHVKVQAPKQFFDHLEAFVEAMQKKYGKFEFLAFWRRAIDDFWNWRKKTDEKSARRKKVSGEGKDDAGPEEKKE